MHRDVAGSAQVAALDTTGILILLLFVEVASLLQRHELRWPPTSIDLFLLLNKHQLTNLFR